MNGFVCGIRARTLSPFAYHSLMVQGGTATLPEVISDNALMFGLASTLGMTEARVGLPSKNYRRDLCAMPWRSSVLQCAQPVLLPPLAKRLNLEEEAGIKQSLYKKTTSGNLKTYFHIQEVPPGVTFTGALFGFDPFKYSGQNQLVIRVGLHRNGMLLLQPSSIEQVRLNAATAALFSREISVKRFLLYSLQLSDWMSPEDALQEVQQWQ